MKTWTVHLRRDAAPVLVREGFSWGALVFGPFWLAAHRAWVPAAIDLAAGALVIALADGTVAATLLVALAVAQGLFGRDLVRWSLDGRGFTLAHVLAARDDAGAFARLLQRRPDLVGAHLPPGELR